MNYYYCCCHVAFVAADGTKMPAVLNLWIKLTQFSSIFQRIQAVWSSILFFKCCALMLAPSLSTSIFFIDYRCFASCGSFSKIPMVNEEEKYINSNNNNNNNNNDNIKKISMLGSAQILRKVLNVWSEWMTCVSNAPGAWYAPGWWMKRHQQRLW